MALRRAWYKSSEYKQCMGPKTLGDGSVVEVVAMTISSLDGSDSFRLTRIYPWGYEQVIEFKILPHGETQYSRQDPGPASPVKHLTEAQRKRQFEEAVAAGELNITARGAVPGQGISDTYVHETRKHITRSADFEDEFDRMHLARVMQSDHSTMHGRGAPAPVKIPSSLGSIETFDANLGAPPRPQRG